MGRDRVVPNGAAGMSSDGPAGATTVIHAAGGLVWRRGTTGREIAVVRRARYGEEWTLPKGKLRPEETWEAAAVREVREETGCVVERGPFAGGQIYQVDGRPKVVLYWHMGLLRERPVADPEEARELRWLTPAAAQARLTHPGEQRLLAEALAGAPPLA
jgi:ADP-ribose pyrophosphatase YjhB (NUDIX family)